MSKKYFLTIKYGKVGLTDWLTATATADNIETLEGFASGYKYALAACGWKDFAFIVMIEHGHEPTPYISTEKKVGTLDKVDKPRRYRIIDASGQVIFESTSHEAFMFQLIDLEAGCALQASDDGIKWVTLSKMISA